MKRYYYILLFIFSLFAQPLSAREFDGYTEEHPLIIACDWDFRPFEFLDSDGSPAGYNVEVLGIILNNLNIPHKFVMQEWHAASELFISRKADLLHALSSYYNKPPFIQTKRYVNYYTVRALRRIDTPPFPGISKLWQGKVGIKKNDYAALRVYELDSIPYETEYLSPKDGLTRVRNKQCDYYLWGQIPLSSKVQELAVDSVTLDEIPDISAGELHIIGYDQDLLNDIDDQYTRMEQSGDLQRIYDKWFHPDLVHDDASPAAPFILITLIVAGVVVFVASRLITLRVKAAVRRSSDLNSMMKQALEMDENYVLEYDIVSGHVRNLHGQLLPERGVTMEEFIERTSDEQREDFRNHIECLKRGDCEARALQITWNAGTLDKPVWKSFYGSAILEREHRLPRYVVHTLKDITREVEEERRNESLGSTYRKVFDTNMMAMSFYDGKGRLLDLNQKMRTLFNNNEECIQYFFEHSLFDDPYTKVMVRGDNPEPFHACGHIQYPQFGLDKYVESRIVPLFDENGNLVYYIATVRDITAEREMYMNLREHERQLKKTHNAIDDYERQLRYLLEESNMYVWTLDMKDSIIRFSRTLREAEISMSMQDYIAGLAPEELEYSTTVLNEKVMHNQPFNAVHKFNYNPFTEGVSWLSISAIPVFDQEGNIEKYFGIVRDITDLMSAQQRLKEETMRAKDSGRLKSAFLANMTHEIRTPLNAIVGFSDLLQMVDTSEERREFIRIIRNNCDMLLRLINDILEASSMGQSIAIKVEDIDLATVFDDICQTLAQRVQNAEVAFLKDNPYDTFPVTLDPGRLQQVLTNFVTNAVKYTKKGHIRVGYRKESRNIDGVGKDGLCFYCEDTGTGIPKEKQSAVFERFVKLNDFVQGTGLGLSICKAIVDKAGGRIGVSSEGEGHGSTFWFWIPC